MDISAVQLIVASESVFRTIHEAAFNAASNEGCLSDEQMQIQMYEWYRCTIKNITTRIERVQLLLSCICMMTPGSRCPPVRYRTAKPVPDCVETISWGAFVCEAAVLCDVETSMTPR